MASIAQPKGLSSAPHFRMIAFASARSRSENPRQLLETSRMKRTTILTLLFGALLASTTTAGSAQSADQKTRLQIAEQMFQERCKKRGSSFIERPRMSRGCF
jgi:hypothetical protein